VKLYNFFVRGYKILEVQLQAVPNLVSWLMLWISCSLACEDEHALVERTHSTDINAGPSAVRCVSVCISQLYN